RGLLGIVRVVHGVHVSIPVQEFLESVLDVGWTTRTRIPSAGAVRAAGSDSSVTRCACAPSAAAAAAISAPCGVVKKRRSRAGGAAACSSPEKILPPPSSTTTTSSAGRGSSGPISSPVRSCRALRSPTSSRTLPGSASPARARPPAIAVVPSVPASPRFATTRAQVPPACCPRSRPRPEEPRTSTPSGPEAVRDDPGGGGACMLLEVAHQARGAEDQHVLRAGGLPAGERGALLPAAGQRRRRRGGGRAPGVQMRLPLLRRAGPLLLADGGGDHE